MKLLEKFRMLAFWSLDFMAGSPIKKHYNEVCKVMQNPLDNDNDVVSKKNLSDLLNHAIHTTKFYNHLKSTAGISDFPIVNKAIIRESFDSFCSGKYSKSDLIQVVTSGSTGTPFKVYHDRNKKLRNHADTIYFASLAGFRIGAKLIYMKIFARQKTRSPLHYWMQNILPVDVIKLNDLQIAQLISQIKKEKSSFNFLGYSSSLELVCKYLDKNHTGKVDANVKSVISISESLNEYTKVTFKKYFNVQAVSRYSNLENGIIAQQVTDDSGRYLVNTASYVLEILKLDNNEPAESGQLGRIVITDLFNYGMPLIRYDTGDIGAYAVEPDNSGNTYLSSIEGRKLDLLFDTSGNLVSSYIVYKNMWQYTEIIQYQLIQESKTEYVFKINIEGSFNKEVQLINEFKEYLGEDAIFNVEYVSEIPLLNSGKRRKIVNNYIKG